MNLYTIVITVQGTGKIRHFVKAPDELEARERIKTAYPDRHIHFHKVILADLEWA